MLRYLSSLVMIATPATADVPRVVADIAPVHSLVAQVMQGVGEPGLMIAPGTSPHHHAMRPSEAAMLSEAQLVVWVGPALTPWLAGPVDNLAGDAERLTWAEVSAPVLLPFREGALFGAHDHDHGHDADDHAESGGKDPHIWLDPVNAQAFLDEIGDVLSRLDPENAAAYRANADAARADLSALTDEIDRGLAAVRGRPFIVLHDGFHYFEARFGVEAVGAISASDAETPGAARIRELQKALRDQGPLCAFTEPQVGGRLIELVSGDLQVETGVLDPIGVGLEPGPDLYGQLMRAMAAEMADCLSRRD